MRIGWHTWDPGLFTHEPNAAGGAAWTRKLWADLQNVKHQIVWLPDGPVPEGAKEGNPDVVVLCWRWRMHDSYADRNAAYESQMKWIEYAFKHDLPIVVHDQDHKISESDTATLKDVKAIMTAPELNPRPGFKTLMYPNPYSLTYRGYFSNRPIDLVYVGNNYERLDQAVQFTKYAAFSQSVIFYGNWLTDGPDRSAAQVRELMPRVRFESRVPGNEVISKLRQGRFTIHLHKESYGPVGFMTFRWAEAAAALTPAFIPHTFWLPDSWYRELAPMIVPGGQTLAHLIKVMEPEVRLHCWRVQSQFVAEFMSSLPWIRLLRDL